MRRKLHWEECHITHGGGFMDTTEVEQMDKDMCSAQLYCKVYKIKNRKKTLRIFVTITSNNPSQ